MITLLSWLLATSFSHADPMSIPWPPRQSKVLCGGTVDGADIRFHVTVPGEVLGGQSEDGRILVFLDLHKPGQVRVLVSDALSDADYERREAILGKLSPEDANFLRTLSPTRIAEIYAGMTDRLVQIDFTAKEHRLSLSCSEIIDANAM